MVRRVLILITLLVLTTHCQNRGNIPSEYIEKYYKFVEFLVQSPLTQADKDLLYQEIYNSSVQNYQQTMQLLAGYVAYYDTIMKYKDPYVRGFLRSWIIGVFYPSLLQQYQMYGSKFALHQLIDKYSPVLVVDRRTNLAFTERDYQGFINFLSFVHRLKGESFTPPANFKQQLINMFNSDAKYAKSMVAAMGVYGFQIGDVYNRMSPSEREKFKQQVFSAVNFNKGQQGYGNTYSNYLNAQNYINFMSQVLKTQHDISMSIIYNMDAGYEVEYKYYDDY